MKTRRNSPFLRLFVSLTVFILASCASQNEKANRHFWRSVSALNLLVDDKTKGFVVIDDDGCVTCNKSLAKAVTQMLDDTDIKFIITADRTRIDLSQFLDKKNNPNIVFDRKKSIFIEGIPTKSSIIFINNNKIDTIIVINAEDLKNQLTLMQQRFACK